MNSMTLMRRFILRDNSSLVGTIKSSRMPYYDVSTSSIKFKARPVLILKAENESGFSDFTVLPISSISSKKNIDPKFDVEVTKNMYPLLKLTKDECYIRCGKFMTINQNDLGIPEISNLKDSYPDLWEHIISLAKEYISDVK